MGLENCKMTLRNYVMLHLKIDIRIKVVMFLITRVVLIEKKL